MSKKLVGTVALVASMAFGAAESEAVQWDTSGFVAVGADCPAPGDIMALPIGNDLIVLFTSSPSAMDMTLSGFGPLQDWRHCTLVVPAELQPGDYAASLTQSAAFELRLDGSSEATFDAVGWFFGQPVDLHASYPPMSNPQGLQQAVNATYVFGPDPGVASCSGLQDTIGSYVTTLSIAAKRKSYFEVVKFELSAPATSSFKVEFVPVGGRVCNHNGGNVAP